MPPIGPRLFFSSVVAAALQLVSGADGNVSALLDGKGALVVIGDELGNDVRIGRTGKPGEFVVSGNGTTVNGMTEVVLVSERVKALLGPGHDRLQVDGNIGGDVLVLGGEGNDSLSLGCPVIAGNACLAGGPGEDVLDVQDSSVLTDLLLIGGPDDDRFQFFFSSVGGRLTIDAGAGDDELTMAEQRLGGSLSVAGGPGDDLLRLERSELSGDALIMTAAGRDRVELEELALGAAIKIGLGTEEDQLSLSDTEIAGPALFDGGPDKDVYVDGGGNTFLAGPPGLLRFECPPARL